MKKNEIFPLLCISALAFLLRIYFLDTRLFFGPEQGRDFLVIRGIVRNQNHTFIGSKTDIDGIFHGPLYYYVSALPFAISRGDPYAVSLFLIFIQSVSVMIIYLLTYELTHSKRAGILACIFFSVSFGSIVYARWLSNPPLSIPLSALFFLFFIRFLRGKQWYLVGVAIVYGLLGQAEFINYLLFGVIIFGFMTFYGKECMRIKRSIALATVMIGCLVAFAHYVLFDIRHNYLIFQNIVRLIAGKSGYTLSLQNALSGVIAMFFDQFSYAFGIRSWWLGIPLTCIVMCFLLIQIKKQKLFMLLILWIVLPPVTLLLLRHSVLEQLFAGMIAGYIVGVAVFADWILRTRYWTISAGIIGIIVYMNLRAVFVNLPNNDDFFFQSPQPRAYYSDQLKVIDWVHRQSNGRPYAFQVYTIPYYWQDHWDYLFWYKRIRDSIKTTNSERPTITYVISQKDRSNTLFFDTWYSDTIARFGEPVRQFEAGEYKVEERDGIAL